MVHIVFIWAVSHCVIIERNYVDRIYTQEKCVSEYEQILTLAGKGYVNLTVIVSESRK